MKVCQSACNIKERPIIYIFYQNLVVLILHLETLTFFVKELIYKITPLTHFYLPWSEQINDKSSLVLKFSSVYIPRDYIYAVLTILMQSANPALIPELHLKCNGIQFRFLSFEKLTQIRIFDLKQHALLSTHFFK